MADRAELQPWSHLSFSFLVATGRGLVQFEQPGRQHALQRPFRQDASKRNEELLRREPGSAVVRRSGT